LLLLPSATVDEPEAMRVRRRSGAHEGSAHRPEPTTVRLSLEVKKLPVLTTSAEV